MVSDLYFNVNMVNFCNILNLRICKFLDDVDSIGI